MHQPGLVRGVLQQPVEPEACRTQAIPDVVVVQPGPLAYPGAPGPLYAGEVVIPADSFRRLKPSAALTDSVSGT
jgi:hypothetical protein